MAEVTQCYRIFKTDTGVGGQVMGLPLDQLTAGEVLIRSQYSSVNYKDALAGSGTGAILKKFPLNGGIDVAGTVVRSQSDEVPVGSEVLVTGCGLSENFDGGYSEFVSVAKESVVPLPKGLSCRDAMIIGTAGFTAALCVEKMLINGQHVEQGPVVVTGASGGVGSFAVHLLANLGFQVLAVSAKSEARDWLQQLGAHQVVSPESLNLGQRPLEKGQFAGAVDNVGGELLSRLLPSIGLRGNVACVGMAGGASINGTVMPMILRGVSLLGISSNNTPRPLRLHIWKKLAQDWQVNSLESFVSGEVNLAGLDGAFQRLLQRQSRGRILVSL